ncbi:AI-2E family transporter [Hyalangium gracile]|uniref:AI-2E family transporter n=1 Tax=Hyalangium gracile TaxID=394092 RepID=UPI001CCCF34C|nr:AI-2E family transporter [Hyalangium gracile]
MNWAQPTLAGMARFCGQCLLIAAFLYVVGYVVRSLPLVFLSLFVALLLTSLLQPVADWLGRHRIPSTLAALAAMLLGLAFVGGLLAFIIPRTVAELSAHADMLAQRAQHLALSLTRILPGQEASLDELARRATQWGRQNAQVLATGAASGLTALTTVVTGGLLVLVLTFFFVRDGHGMARAILRLLSPRRRALAGAAAGQAWRTLSGWVRGTALVALMDGAGVGIGLLILGVPLVLPLALLTFLGAFVPVIGAVLAGAVAVLVAWATVGTQAALITLGIVLAVQQLEGNVLQPMIMGRVLPLHPAVVLLAVTVGALVASIAGAFVAVPLLAAVTAGTQAFLAEGRKLRTRDTEPSETPEEPADGQEGHPPAHH